MSEEGLILAIGRLERALARVEASAAKPAPPAPPVEDSDAQAALLSLAERHDKLKQQVETAITALDRLIAKG